MIPCPYCGRHFKNKQALKAHLKHCPVRKGLVPIKTLSNEIEVKEFDFANCHWFIKGKKGFMSILIKINDTLKQQGFNIEKRRERLIGALYALYELEIVQGFSIKPIKQQSQTPQN